MVINKNKSTTKKVVIITGGAGQLGSSICCHFDELNNKVFMADLDENICKKRISKLGLKNTFPLELDVTNIKSIESAFKKIINKFGRIDILVNNAGISAFTSFEKRTFEEFDKVMKVNLYGTFFCSQRALYYMEKQKKGCIVNIGSVYGVKSPDPRIYGNSGRNSPEVYGASKAGVIQMTRYLAVHVKCKKIRINCVSPGGIFNNQDKKFVKNYINKTPMKKMANEDEIAKTIVFLCSDNSSYITGQNIIADGGFTIW
ncbi:short-chain dehydrogenase [Candidatus Woesearchaeota archaeon B3_Woes]|nr:MAG: short-chain dehydrogenase [Candidatus Woesearchaeota archaeon B3_Woes]